MKLRFGSLEKEVKNLRVDVQKIYLLQVRYFIRRLFNIVKNMKIQIIEFV